jgi:hypothetical protein
MPGCFLEHVRWHRDEQKSWVWEGFEAYRLSEPLMEQNVN